MRHRALGWAGYAVALVLALGIRSVLGQPADRNPALATSSTAPAGGDLGHLHAVARNPGDGSVYLASHAGVFRLDDGRPRLVTEVGQDTRVLLATGPDEFLAAGHVGRGEGSQRIGLVISTDAALSWEVVSLSGTADFHALVDAHDLIYAAEATRGELLVSGDGGATWERRGDVELSVLAVDPADAEHLIGVDVDGRVVESADGGVSWMMASSPATMFTSIVWTERLGAIASAADGTTWRRSPAGDWVAAGRLPGMAPVLAADGGGVLAATGSGEVLRSIDGGTTWRPQR